MGDSQWLTRPRFFSGKLITPEDLELEQQYFREKLKRHNRSLHGFGIVSGFKVTTKSGQIIVEPGLALDCEGNELAIETVQSIVPPSTADWHTAFVNVSFVEECAGTISPPGAEEAASNLAGTITESFMLALTQKNFNQGHRHLRARWLACGRPHALTIAKLTKHSQGWRVDRGYRAPTIK
jgi:hypothetical protein